MTITGLMGRKDARIATGAGRTEVADEAARARVAEALRQAAVARLRDETPPNVVAILLDRREPTSLEEIMSVTGLRERHALSQVRDLASQDLVLIDDSVSPVEIHPIALFTEKNETAQAHLVY